MPTTKATGKELVQRWIIQNEGLGKTMDEMMGTTFVYGNEVLTLVADEKDSFRIESQIGRVVVFRKIDELDLSHSCRACGLEHHSHKEAIECCMDVEL
ncbi:hypothetical protein [Ammoniphilus sp. 3BR4]|uniref:hypothetical protein n=1 Tax=Ammoniphilus sp. 3BR4 TaxID=3158265 RepID=UPI003465471D